MAQYIEIEDAWRTTKFCCPACGQEVCSEDGEFADKPCEHVLFSWINEVGEYYNPCPEIQRMVEESERTDELESCPFDEEFQQLFPDNAILFAFTSHGMACGPVSTTVVHGIRFPHIDDE